MLTAPGEQNCQSAYTSWPTIYIAGTSFIINIAVRTKGQSRHVRGVEKVTFVCAPHLLPGTPGSLNIGGRQVTAACYHGQCGHRWRQADVDVCVCKLGANADVLC